MKGHAQGDRLNWNLELNVADSWETVATNSSEWNQKKAWPGNSCTLLSGSLYQWENQGKVLTEVTCSKVIPVDYW